LNPDSLILFVTEYKIVIVLSLLLIEQATYLLPVNLVYEKGIVVGKFKIGETPSLFTVKKIDGLRIVFEGDRLFVRLCLLPEWVPGFFPSPFIGYVKVQDDGHFFVKVGPITFVLVILFVFHQVSTYGIQGFWNLLGVAILALAFYAYLAVTFIHVVNKNFERA